MADDPEGAQLEEVLDAGGAMAGHMAGQLDPHAVAADAGGEAAVAGGWGGLAALAAGWEAALAPDGPVVAPAEGANAPAGGADEPAAPGGAAAPAAPKAGAKPVPKPKPKPKNTGCSKCRYATKGCAVCRAWAEAAKRGYYFGEDSAVHNDGPDD